MGASSREGPHTITMAGELTALCFVTLYKSVEQVINIPTCRSTLTSTQFKSILHSKPTQLLYYHSGLGPSLLYWWCVSQLCRHHLPNTSLRVTSHRGDHLSTDITVPTTLPTI